MENSIVPVNMKDFVVNAGSAHDGVQVIFRFPNNYGASIVRHSFSYGIELAVAKFNSEDNDDWEICYSTPITSDVIGYLDEGGVLEILMQINSL